MYYIVVALKSEAQAFVDYFKLKKDKLSKHTIYKNDDMILIISGVGVYNSRLATQVLLNYFDILDDDIFFNVGVCGSKYNVGELLDISCINYNDNLYRLKNGNNTITCLDYGVDEKNIYDIVDMESFGFYDAVTHNIAIKQSYIFKVVSDNFQPETLTKDMVKNLIFKNIKKILGIDND